MLGETSEYIALKTLQKRRYLFVSYKSNILTHKESSREKKNDRKPLSFQNLYTEREKPLEDFRIHRGKIR